MDLRRGDHAPAEVFVHLLQSSLRACLLQSCGHRAMLSWRLALLLLGVTAHAKDVPGNEKDPEQSAFAVWRTNVNRISVESLAAQIGVSLLQVASVPPSHMVTPLLLTLSRRGCKLIQNLGLLSPEQPGRSWTKME